MNDGLLRVTMDLMVRTIRAPQPRYGAMSTNPALDPTVKASSGMGAIGWHNRPRQAANVRIVEVAAELLPPYSGFNPNQSLISGFGDRRDSGSKAGISRAK